MTIITYSDRKAETHPYIPLSDEAKTGIAHDVNEIGRFLYK
ncbi:hypothetical protein ARSQ2_00058 [Arsenophonus endosymbiont of Bemisia tabaci Q2]|nr:hypothetical protein ARSQ2_00058 [Arsenophonus endosymbiont of Bemisia tabaci Q2]